MKKLHFLAAVAFVLLFSLSAGAATPKGHLVIVGGGGRTDKIGEAYVKYSGAPEAAFLVIGTASDTPMETAEKFAESIKKLGAGETRCIAPTHEECNDPEYVNKVMDGVGGVFFCGGKQPYRQHYEGHAAPRAPDEVVYGRRNDQRLERRSGDDEREDAYRKPRGPFR